MRLQRTANKIQAQHKPITQLTPLSGSAQVETSNNGLTTKILLAQEIKHSLGIENLAAANPLDISFPSNRRAKAKWMGTPPVIWDHFLNLEEYLGKERLNPLSSADVTVMMTWAMIEIVSRLTPQTLNYNYSDSNLMKTAVEEPPYHSASYCQGCENTRVNAAITLRVILEKIGDSLNDGATIIRKLINSSTNKVKEQGIAAAINSYKGNWRTDIYETGLIETFKKEGNDDYRVSVAFAIASANPKIILENHSVEGVNFRPIDRLLYDRDIRVKTNISHGIASLLLAQIGEGKYYKDFYEVPNLSVQDRIDCFDYSLKALEQIYADSYFNENKALLLGNLSETIAIATNNALINSVRSTWGISEYERLIGRLSQINLIEFIKNISKFYFFANAAPIIDRVLHTRAKTYDKPLMHYLSLRDELIKLKQETSSTSESSNINECIQKIDSAISVYLKNTPIQSINWGSSSDFNSTYVKLLSLLKETKNDNIQFEILNLLDTLHTQRKSLENLNSIPFENIAAQNKLKTCESLKYAIYSKSIPSDFANPNLSTPQGMALQLYRQTSKSFKDYFGMSGLKSRAIKIAETTLSKESIFVSFMLIIASIFKKPTPKSERTIGLLLSGAPGTGKSSFGEVLSNELALPLEILISNKITEDENGELIISRNNDKHSADKYVEELLKSGPCVLLVDEIDELISSGNTDYNSKIIELFNKIKEQLHSTIVIATTNRPFLDSSFGIKMNQDGSSKELDDLLKKDLPPDLVKLFEPCYLFHKKSVVEGFAQNYFEQLQRKGKLGGHLDLDIVRASKLARSLTPQKIINSLSSITLTAESIIEKLRSLREQQGITKQQETVIRTSIQILQSSETHKVEGELDYIELAIAAEDIPANLIVETIRNSPSPLNQTALIESLTKLQA